MKTTPSSTGINLENHTPRIIALVLLAAVALLAFSGCKSDTPAAVAVGTDPSGIYTLVSVDGKMVPCAVQHEGVDMTVKAGEFIINTNGHCTSRSTFAVASYKDTQREVEATYTVSGEALTMKWKGGGMTKGRVEGNRFTMNNEGMIFIYQK